MKNVTEPTHFESLYPEDSQHETVKKMLELIKKGGSIQLIGLPGTGRSNLLRFLSYNNNARVLHLSENYKWFHFVYMDTSEMKGRSEADLIKFILISLSYSLSERNMKKEQEKINEFLKEATDTKDELILFQVLKKTIDYLSIEKELTVVFLLDRFNTYIPSVSSTFFNNLRILRNRAKYRFSCVFSLERPLSDVLETTVYTEFYEFIAENTLYLSLFNSTSNEFRLSYLEKISNKSLSENIKKELIRLTGGHGKLLRIGAEVILAEDVEPKNLTTFLLNKKGILTTLLEIWNILTPVEQKAITHDAKSFPNDSYVVKSGLVKTGIIQIPLFEKMIPTFPQPETEKLSYVPETNEILLGNESLTEKFSPSEFRLLRFLMQQNERICEKEEIIEAVWREEQSREGVTDQALDQIIYRLRKKIEQDPNNPAHIMTIKGRGYKFSK